MALTVKDMMAAANAVVPKITVAEAQSLLAQGGLLVDVRDQPEVEKSGKAAGALHISRGMLEFRADDATPYHNPELRKNRAVILYCASGGRSALSGKLLKDMGYQRVYNLGGFASWLENGGAVDGAIEQGM